MFGYFLSVSIVLVDFKKNIYSSLYGIATASHCLKARRPSTLRQYGNLMFVLLSLICQFHLMLEFFIWLFEARKLQSNIAL